jgi:hypothetical protein
MRSIFSLTAALLLAPLAFAEMKTGTPEVKSISAMAFGPNGTLFIGDPVSATIFAITTGDDKPSGKDDVKVEKITETIGSLIGVPANQVTINDVKVNPASGNVFLAVTRGKGMDAASMVMKLTRGGKLEEFPLKLVKFDSTKLTNATDKQRTEAITSLGYVNGKVLVAGLSNEEFASTLRVLPYPFSGTADKGTGVKIYHGAHGKFETQAPIRTFTTYKIGEADHVIAAYTCTPLVKIPVGELQPGAKVTGTTMAELGNRNRPLDMIVYKKDGKDFVLMANNARGVMKIGTDSFANSPNITERPKGDTAGVAYEKIDSLKGVEQLDKLDDARAVMLMKTDTGMNLVSVNLP